MSIKDKNIYMFVIICLILVSCKSNKNEAYKKKITEFEYCHIYSKAIDSLSNFKTNNLERYGFLQAGDWYLDSLLCFNSKKNKFISSILYTNSNTKNAVSDGIIFFFGEKIDSNWFFFIGASIHIPREMVKNHPNNKPLNYQQLHKIALNNVYENCLLWNGDINEDIFKKLFDDNLMNFIRYQNKQEYDKLLIAYCKGIWAEKFNPYTQESFSFNYNKNKKTVDFSFRLKTFDSIYNQPVQYKIIYQHKELEYPIGLCEPYWCDEIDWNKEKFAKVQIKNVPENSDVIIKIQILYFPNVKSPVFGPFIFNTGKINNKINS